MPRKSRRFKQQDMNHNEHWQQAWNEPETIDAARKNAMLNNIHQRTTTSRRRKKQLFFIAISAAAAILVALYIKIPAGDSGAPEIKWQELASNDSTKKVILNDGSEVWLAPHSVLQVNSNFTQQRRTVLAKGTVFFSVAKDATHPFTITVNRQQITVVGTAFTIRKTDTTDLQLTVKEGKVALDNTSGRRFLTAGQQVRTTGGITGAIETVDQMAADWWLQKQVRLQNISLEELINRIEAYYHVKLSHGLINSKMKVTLTWDMSISLQQNLMVLNSLTGYNIH